jgi:hypothetical protein
MTRIVISISIVALLLSASSPDVTYAAEPALDRVSVQTVGLRHVNDGLGPSPGEVSTQNTVYGNCGWASFFVYPRGSGRALFSGDAGTSHWAPIVFADWRIDWRNNLAGTSGWIAGQTIQWSWTWSTDHERYTSTGWVFGQLSRLFVRHQDGHACVGFVPSDWTWIE